MPSPLDYISSDGFRKKLMARNLTPYNKSPNIPSPPITFEYQQSDIESRFGALNNYLNLWNTIDPIRFYKKDQPNSTFKSYIENPELGIEKVLFGWHPSPDSHEAWAHELVRYIKEHNLLA